MSSESKLTESQKARIEKNRQKALLLKKSKVIAHPYLRNLSVAVESLDKKVITVEGNKFIDSGGGFLIEEEDQDPDKPVTIVEKPAAILKSDRPKCEECNEEFADSYLLQTFDHPVCDKCRDNEVKHSLITKTDAKNEYLLKDCDFDKREPPLKCIIRKNPHNVKWGEMKLYLLLQVERRALEVWGSEENLEEEREKREEKKVLSKTRKFNKNMKALRMNVRSSLFDRTSRASHEHEFGPETYNEDDDTYTHTCKTCNYVETFEKM